MAESKARRSGEDKDLPADEKGPGADEVQSAMDVATKRGFFGVETDTTPNENYTVKGQSAGKPTPETDKK